MKGYASMFEKWPTVISRYRKYDSMSKNLFKVNLMPTLHIYYKIRSPVVYLILSYALKIALFSFLFFKFKISAHIRFCPEVIFADVKLILVTFEGKWMYFSLKHFPYTPYTIYLWLIWCMLSKIPKILIFWLSNLY